jgi:hypothetical protein
MDEEDEDGIAEDLPSKSRFKDPYGDNTCDHDHGNGHGHSHSHSNGNTANNMSKNLGSIMVNNTNANRKPNMNNFSSMAPGSTPSASMFRSISTQGNNNLASNMRFSNNRSTTRGTRRSDTSAPFSHEYTYYDRRRAGANMSKEEYDVCAEALGQELWALMTVTVDMLWDTEQLMEKMIVIATRCVCIYIYIYIYIYI